MEANKLKVGIFVPCCVDQFSTRTARNMVALLKGVGFLCEYPSEQTCCGQGLYLNGDRAGAKQLGDKMIEMFRPYDYVVTCSSGCVAYAKRYFEELFRNSTNHNESRKFVDKLYDITDFLVNEVHYQPHNVAFPHRVVFLDHCRTLRDYGLKEEPRQLLRAINGLELMPYPDSDVCCGYSGSFTNFFEPISTEMARRKVEAALKVGAQYIVSTEPSCLMHLQSYIDQVGLKIQCKHIVDVMCGQ